MHSDSISVGCCSSSSALIGRNKCPVPGCRAWTGEGAAAAAGSPGPTAPPANMTTRCSGPNVGRLRLSWPHPFLRHFRQLPPRPSLKRPRTLLGEQYLTRGFPVAGIIRSRLPKPAGSRLCLHLNSGVTAPRASSQTQGSILLLCNSSSVLGSNY